MPGKAATHRGSAPRSTRDSSIAVPVRLLSLPDHHVMKQMFVAQFLAYFCGSYTGQRDQPWMLLLPDASSKASALKTVDLPLQAVALAHFATEAAFPGAMTKSNEIYADALGSHRVFGGQVVRGQHSQISRAFELVASNIMLAFFEAIQHIAYEAYSAHMSAAAGVLENIGAEKYKAGVLNQLFFSVRAQTVSFTFEHQTRVLMITDFSDIYDGCTCPFCESGVGRHALERFTSQTDL